VPATVSVLVMRQMVWAVQDSHSPDDTLAVAYCNEYRPLSIALSLHPRCVLAVSRIRDWMSIPSRRHSGRMPVSVVHRHSLVFAVLRLLASEPMTTSAEIHLHELRFFRLHVKRQHTKKSQQVEWNCRGGMFAGTADLSGKPATRERPWLRPPGNLNRRRGLFHPLIITLHH